MNGPGHYLEAERLLECANEVVPYAASNDPKPSIAAILDAEAKYIAAAHVHATLALAAIQASYLPAHDETWQRVIS